MAFTALAPMACLEREKLVQRFRAVIDELLSLIDEELVAAAKGDFTMADSRRAELRRAHTDKRLLRERLQTHVAGHGCGNFRWHIQDRRHARPEGGKQLMKSSTGLGL
jgi:hypothetical protein